MRNAIDRFKEWIARTVRTLCRMLILGVSIAGLILLLLDGISNFFTSSEFTVEEIYIHGNQRITQEEIRTLASIAPGANIWLLDLEELSERLEKHPSIRTAIVRRVPPKKIYIDIEERQTIAFYLRRDGSLMGLDAGGVTLPPPPGFRTNAGVEQIGDSDIRSLLSYPFLRGDIEFPERPGERITNPSILKIMTFLEQLQTECPAFFSEIVEGELKENKDFVLHLRRRIGVFVLRDLNSQDLVKKIDAFWNVMERENLRAIYVDARFPEKGFAVQAEETQTKQWERMHKPHENIEI